MSGSLFTPDLSVVVVTAGMYKNIRRTVVHLRSQTIRDRIEVVMVAANENCFTDLDEAELSGFGSVQRVFTGQSIKNVDKASALGVHRATACLVALVEDHAYPEVDWAEKVLASHASGEWAVVGSTVTNANPRSMLSWTNLLIAYGPWTAPSQKGEKDALPGHNVTYRRKALVAYGEGLDEKLTRSGGLLEDLQEQGNRFYLSDGRLAHANPSRLLPTISLRFNAGRLYGWTRALQGEWTPLHKVLYVVGGPLIPLVRYRRLKAELFGRGRRAELLPRVLPALFFGLVVDALGQMAGYALGPGKAPGILATFEMDRMEHLTSGDRRLLGG